MDIHVLIHTLHAIVVETQQLDIAYTEVLHTKSLYITLVAISYNQGYIVQLLSKIFANVLT